MVVKSEIEFPSWQPPAAFPQAKQAENEPSETAALKSDGYEWSADVSSARKKTLNMPTKSYIDNVINEALKNIKKGENVAENRRIVSIFSNIAGENPVEKELKAYI